MVIPPHHELRKRTSQRTEEMGFPVPDDAINAMKGEIVRACRVMFGGSSVDSVFCTPSRCLHSLQLKYLIKMNRRYINIVYSSSQ